ncbi:MAG: MBOAT family protein [Acetatifactor sp.]|nr:MBOAT family protein [Acetatifactor sp.]
MQFNSFIFILVYLPILIIGYFGLNRISSVAGKFFLIIASAFFYIYGGWNIALILAVSIVLNYFCAVIIRRTKRLLWGGIFLNIALLFYFKYFNFFISTVNNVFKGEFTEREIILPLGISFLTFQQIMYLVNVYNKNIDKVHLSDYLAYILYFPKLLMGPIVEPKELISQINDLELHHINWDNISYGIKIFSFGLFKKLIFADTFSTAVAWGYANIDASTSMDWFLVMLFYTFEIYFDFSGYCDMAIGVSTMLNINLPMNFDSPYTAVSIRDFWKRWHISLTSFLTQYVYIPLGGNKKGKVRTYVNTMIVFVVSGIWHGANWTFILWGVLHGLLSIFDRIFEKAKRNLFEVVKWGTTFLAVNILWLLFRSESITQWKDILIKMYSFQSTEISDGLIGSFLLPETSFLFKILNLEALNTTVRGLNLLIFTIAAFVICLVPDNNYNTLKRNNWITLILSVIAFVWSFLCLSSESFFVYFNF